MEVWDLKLGVLERRRGGSCTERRRHELEKEEARKQED